MWLFNEVSVFCKSVQMGHGRHSLRTSQHHTRVRSQTLDLVKGPLTSATCPTSASACAKHYGMQAETQTHSNKG